MECVVYDALHSEINLQIKLILKEHISDACHNSADKASKL